MGMRVLVAEDETLIALSLVDLLEAEGYEVDLAADGARRWTRRGARGRGSGRW